MPCSLSHCGACTLTWEAWFKAVLLSSSPSWRKSWAFGPWAAHKLVCHGGRLETNSDHRGRHIPLEGSQAFTSPKHPPLPGEWVLLSPLKGAQPHHQLLLEWRYGFLVYCLWPIKWQRWGQNWLSPHDEKKSDESVCLSLKTSSSITLPKYYCYLNLAIAFGRKKIGLHRLSWEAAQQQIPPDSVLVADKVEFNIFQIQDWASLVFCYHNIWKLCCQKLHVL